jgi:hypothetical protein
MKEFINFSHDNNNIKSNKYFKWYIQIIFNSIYSNRPLFHREYEKHHILPKSCGGSNEINNICILTYKEHYICHLLLTKFLLKYEHKRNMQFALHTFFHFDKNRVLASKRSLIYENHKKLYSKYLSEREPSNVREEIYTFKNKKTHQIFIGRPIDFIKFSGLTHQEMNHLQNVYNKKASYKHIKNWGIFLDDKQIFSYEIPYKKRKHPTIKCEFCGKVTAKFNYVRWHGKNCKSLISPV